MLAEFESILPPRKKQKTSEITSKGIHLIQDDDLRRGVGHEAIINEDGHLVLKQQIAAKDIEEE